MFGCCKLPFMVESKARIRGHREKVHNLARRVMKENDMESSNVDLVTLMLKAFSFTCEPVLMAIDRVSKDAHKELVKAYQEQIVECFKLTKELLQVLEKPVALSDQLSMEIRRQTYQFSSFLPGEYFKYLSRY